MSGTARLGDTNYLRAFKRAVDIKRGDVVLLREPTEPTGWAYHEIQAIENDGPKRVKVRSIMGPIWTLPRGHEVEFLIEEKSA